MTYQQSTNNDHTNDPYANVTAYIQQQGLPGLNKYAQDQLDSWKKIPLNIAVTGRSGVGKSTFINTVRMLAPEDDGAATVSVVECTLVPTSYVHPHHDNLTFWDLPGKDSQVSTTSVSRFLQVLERRTSHEQLIFVKLIMKNMTSFSSCANRVSLKTIFGLLKKLLSKTKSFSLFARKLMSIWKMHSVIIEVHSMK
jgi:predicted GTPase